MKMGCLRRWATCHFADGLSNTRARKSWADQAGGQRAAVGERESPAGPLHKGSFGPKCTIQFCKLSLSFSKANIEEFCFVFHLYLI
jgi:hypothetical protein